MVEVPRGISNTVPTPDDPPRPVAPKILPLPSMTRLPKGLAPLSPSKDATVVIAPVDFGISNMVPSPHMPPRLVAPKRLPAPSWIRPEYGVPPFGASMSDPSVVIVGTQRRSNCSRHRAFDLGARLPGRRLGPRLSRN